MGNDLSGRLFYEPLVNIKYQNLYLRIVCLNIIILN